jgi:2-polyprenyl-3-methyl-5-hydroxy-6-metoxy-1,4-benzoquinol methylase
VSDSAPDFTKSGVYSGLDYPHCCICDTSNFHRLFVAPVQNYQRGVFDLDDFPIVKCNQCGLIYVNPRISVEANNKYYEFLLTEDHDFLDKHFFETYSVHKKQIDRYIRIIKKTKFDGRILDIGCGNGFFLTRARESGFQVEGQEISSLFINYCRQNLDLTVYSGELDSLNLEAGSYDVITMFDVIEHVYLPGKLLKECNRLLKPDGLLVVTTHDIGNFFAKLYGVKWHMIYPIGHVWYFTRVTLRSLLRKEGFREIYSGSAYIADKTWPKSVFNFFTSIIKSVILRSLIIYIYSPLSKIFPFLTKWKIKLGNQTMNHQKLLFLAGSQVNLNDEILSISQPYKFR